MKAPCCFNWCCNFSTAISRGIVWPPSASTAAVPAASPIAKQAPETRAADWPSWVIEAQRPATNRLSMPSGTSMRYGSSLKPRAAGAAARIVERSAAEHVLAREHIAADHAPGFADAELRRQIDDVGFFKPRHHAQEFEGVERLAAAIDFAAREMRGFEAV